MIDVDPANLPSPDKVNAWSSEEYVSGLRHDPACALYNSDFRQLLDVAFKVAAKEGESYIDLLAANRAVVARNVTDNLYDRHIYPIFVR